MAFGGGGFRRGGGGFRRRFNDGPREMTKIKCAECGKEDEVPFKPREGSKVLCKECFMKSKGITPRQPMKEEADESEEVEESEEDMDEEMSEDEE